jgi:hypothetical protein
MRVSRFNHPRPAACIYGQSRGSRGPHTFAMELRQTQLNNRTTRRLNIQTKPAAGSTSVRSASHLQEHCPKSGTRISNQPAGGADTLGTTTGRKGHRIWMPNRAAGSQARCGFCAAAYYRHRAPAPRLYREAIHHCFGSRKPWATHGRNLPQIGHSDFDGDGVRDASRLKRAIRSAPNLALFPALLTAHNLRGAVGTTNAPTRTGTQHFGTEGP